MAAAKGGGSQLLQLFVIALLALGVVAIGYSELSRTYSPKKADRSAKSRALSRELHGEAGKPAPARRSESAKRAEQRSWSSGNRSDRLGSDDKKALSDLLQKVAP